MSNNMKGDSEEMGTVVSYVTQDVKPDRIEPSKSGLTFLQSWLRQVTPSNADHSSCASVAPPPPLTSTTANSSKRRKGRPRKYVAAAGDRTLTGDALLVDTTTDSGLDRFTAMPREPTQPEQPHPVPAVPITLPPPPLIQQDPVPSARMKPAARVTKTIRQKERVFRQRRRQPVQFIPSVETRPKVQPRRSKSLATTSKPTQVTATVNSATAPVKRGRGRPRKYPLPTTEPTRLPPARAVVAREVATTGRRFNDVEDDSSDSDVIVIGYTAARDVTSGTQERRYRVQASTVDKDRRSATGTSSCTQRQSNVIVPSSEPTQPAKRPRGRPRKYLRPDDDAATSLGCPKPTAAITGKSGFSTRSERGSASADRRRMTRASTAAQIRHEWDTSRSITDSSLNPTRTAPPPLYYELSSSDSDSPRPDIRSDLGAKPHNPQRNRRRRRSIPSRSLELSFSSIEKDDVSMEAACPTSGRLSCRKSPTEMTSTPRYERSTSVKDSTLRSRWINVDQRAREITTTAVIHRDADCRPTTSTRLANRNPAGAITRPSPESAVVQRRQRRRRRSSDSDDPDWRRYPCKPSRRSSSEKSGSLSTSAKSTRTQTMSPHGSIGVPMTHDEPELDVLVELQRRLASTTDGYVLRKVVEIIEASGRYHVEDATFDFDLCSLETGTIVKLRRCLGV